MSALPVTLELCISLKIPYSMHSSRLSPIRKYRMMAHEIMRRLRGLRGRHGASQFEGARKRIHEREVVSKVDDSEIQSMEFLACGLKASSQANGVGPCLGSSAQHQIETSRLHPSILTGYPHIRIPFEKIETSPCIPRFLTMQREDHEGRQH